MRPLLLQLRLGQGRRRLTESACCWARATTSSSWPTGESPRPSMLPRMGSLMMTAGGLALCMPTLSELGPSIVLTARPFVGTTEWTDV